MYMDARWGSSMIHVDRFMSKGWTVLTFPLSLPRALGRAGCARYQRQGRGRAPAPTQSPNLLPPRSLLCIGRNFAQTCTLKLVLEVLCSLWPLHDSEGHPSRAELAAALQLCRVRQIHFVSF